MACQQWAEKLDAYLDGEVPVDEQRALREHLRGCATCASESFDRLQAKRAIQMAGQRFVPDAAFRARIQNSLAKARPLQRKWQWFPALAFSGIAALLIVGT